MKKQNAKKKAKEAPPKPEDVQPIDEKENPFDFGGLPKRDLKKNLGCG